MSRFNEYNFDRFFLHLLFAGVGAGLAAVPQATGLVEWDGTIEAIIVLLASSAASFVARKRVEYGDEEDAG